MTAYGQDLMTADKSPTTLGSVGRGRPSFLVTTAAFLRLLGLGSLTELPPRPIPK